MNNNSTTALIEAILYLENKPVDLTFLSKITELPQGVLIEAIDALNREYQNAEHGLEIVEIGGGYCFTPKKTLWNSLKSYLTVMLRILFMKKTVPCAKKSGRVVFGSEEMRRGVRS